GITQRTSRHIVIIMQRRLQHSQVNPDRAGNKISIRVPPTTSIYRTCIHTGSTTDTIQSFDMLLVGEYLTTSVIYNNNVKLPTLSRLSVMRSICSNGLSCSRTGQQAGEHS